jgi:hypothetical protein
MADRNASMIAAAETTLAVGAIFLVSGRLALFVPGQVSRDFCRRLGTS